VGGLLALVACTQIQKQEITYKLKAVLNILQSNEVMALAWREAKRSGGRKPHLILTANRYKGTGTKLGEGSFAITSSSVQATSLPLSLNFKRPPAHPA
jgi:hypothetical protein